MRIILALVAVGLVGCGDDSGSGDSEESKATLPLPPLTLCNFHLQNLHSALLQYQGTYGSLPWQTGGQFWVALSLTTPPIIAGGKLMWYNCPVSGYNPPPGSCEYRGPSGDANSYAPTDPIAADLVGAHGIGQGGHVLLKNGTLVLAAETDPLWIYAGVKTSP